MPTLGTAATFVADTVMSNAVRTLRIFYEDVALFYGDVALEAWRDSPVLMAALEAVEAGVCILNVVAEQHPEPSYTSTTYTTLGQLCNVVHRAPTLTPRGRQQVRAAEEACLRLLDVLMFNGYDIGKIRAYSLSLRMDENYARQVGD
jgi:hypothetical protein